MIDFMEYGTGCAAGLALDQRVSECGNFLLVFFEQLHRGAHGFTFRLETPGLDLCGDKVFEVFAQGDTGVSWHGGSALLLATQLY